MNQQIFIQTDKFAHSLRYKADTEIEIEFSLDTSNDHVGAQNSTNSTNFGSSEFELLVGTRLPAHIRHDA